MADISLTTTSGVTFTFAEGEVKTIKSKIDTNIENMEISGTGPASSYLYDYNGCRKEISITGHLFTTATSRVSGYSIDTAIEQKQWLESLANGIQQPITFTSNYESLSILSSAGPTPPYQGSFTNTKVMVSNMDFTEVDGEVEIIAFSITFVVGQ